MEARIAVMSVLRRYPSLRLLDPTPRRHLGVAFRGLKTLRVSV